MAAPAEMTSRDFSGKFVLSKTLSGKTQGNATAHGVGDGIRKLLSLAVPHLAVKHYTDAASGLEHVEIEQNLPGVRESSEHRVLDWSENKVENPVFGALVLRSRRVKIEELEVGWLKEGLLPESFVDGAVVHTLAQTDVEKGGEVMRMEQTWGFENIGDAKRYVRHVHLVNAKGEAVEARLVYDYEGPL